MQKTLQRWADTQQAAEYLGVSASLLEKDRVFGLHKIPFSRIGRRIVYDLHDLGTYLEVHKQVWEEGA